MVRETLIQIEWSQGSARPGRQLASVGLGAILGGSSPSRSCLSAPNPCCYGRPPLAQHSHRDMLAALQPSDAAGPAPGGYMLSVPVGMWDVWTWLGGHPPGGSSRRRRLAESKPAGRRLKQSRSVPTSPQTPERGCSPWSCPSNSLLLRASQASAVRPTGRSAVCFVSTGPSSGRQEGGQGQGPAAPAATSRGDLPPPGQTGRIPSEQPRPQRRARPLVVTAEESRENDLSCCMQSSRETRTPSLVTFTAALTASLGAFCSGCLSKQLRLRKAPESLLLVGRLHACELHVCLTVSWGARTASVLGLRSQGRRDRDTDTWCWQEN